MTFIKATLGTDSILFRTDLSRAEQPLEVQWNEGDNWESTQYQSANCSGRTSRMIELCRELSVDAWQVEADEVGMIKLAEVEIAPEPRSISIYRDDVWAGDGYLSADGEVEDCSAVLGEDQDASDETYQMIADAISNGEDEVVRPDGTYTWTIGE